MDVHFTPEVVAVGLDPKSGLLTRSFTVYYEVGDITTGGTGDLTISDVIENTIGIVNIKDPFNTLQVRKSAQI